VETSYNSANFKIISGSGERVPFSYPERVLLLTPILSATNFCKYPFSSLSSFNFLDIGLSPIDAPPFIIIYYISFHVFLVKKSQKVIKNIYNRKMRCYSVFKVHKLRLKEVEK